MACKSILIGCLVLASLLNLVEADASALGTKINGQLSDLIKFIITKLTGLLSGVTANLPVFLQSFLTPDALSSMVDGNFKKLAYGGLKMLVAPLQSLSDFLENNVAQLATDYSVMCAKDLITEMKAFNGDYKTYAATLA